MNKHVDSQRGPGVPEEALKRIVEAVQGLRFGSVEIVVQDGRVVQIERKEKIRLQKPDAVNGTPRTGAD
jgi:hypothetical protein